MKALLPDQKVAAGIGAIYADESLFRVRIHPAARASDPSPERLRRLFAEVRAVLLQAIAENGSSVRDYLDADGTGGEALRRPRGRAPLEPLSWVVRGPAKGAGKV